MGALGHRAAVLELRGCVIAALSLLVAVGCYRSHERSRPGSEVDAHVARPDGGRPDGGRPDAAAATDAGQVPCGDETCGPGDICITGRCAGCCDVPPACIPIPSGCAGEPACECFDADPCGPCTTCQSVAAGAIVCGDCMCACAAPWTPVATPGGPRPIADLRVGDLVYSVDGGTFAVVPIVRRARTVVIHHALVRVTLAGGDVIEMSGGHPTGDGRRFDALAPGDTLGAERIASIATEPYDEPYTYDILPGSDTGTYFAGRAWIGSTLHLGPLALGDLVPR